MKKLFLLIQTTIILIILSTTSCKFGLKQVFYRPNPVEERSATIKEIIPEIDVSSKDIYSFLILADIHFGSAEKQDVQALLDFLCTTEPFPDFCFSLGDITDHGLEEEYVEYNNELVQKLEEMGIKCLNVVGNHDLFNSGWVNFEQYCYPYTSFYKFTLDNLSYYVLDSASGNLSKPQFDALEKAFNNDSNEKIALAHIPLYAEDAVYFVIQDTQERNEILSLFAQNNVKLFIGAHIHDFLVTKYENDMIEVNVPSLLEQKGWTIFTVDKTKNTITCKAWINGEEQ